MNKSLLTNLIALIILCFGFFINNSFLLFTGLFAFSGAITNWLAIHMLFEKVPGLYGSGVIPKQFESFKLAIKHLLMSQFFTQENINRFLKTELDSNISINLEPVIEKIDFNPVYDSLLNEIESSQFGNMLNMIGGKEILTPLKEPFIKKIKNHIIEISQSEQIKEAIINEFQSKSIIYEAKKNIEAIINQRLNELTPQLVKKMIQTLIKKHLGWLVIWGGIFGGIIGFFSAYFLN